MTKVRFEFLDGFRGLAAIWVVFFHALLFNQHLSSTIKFSTNTYLFLFEKGLSVGYLAVSIFIVLSGFCLAIPVVNNELNLKKGFTDYIKRRAKRLIPPYYFALLFSIILILVFPILQSPNNTAWDSKIPITFGGIISHILLIHNLNPSWIYKINGAHWSIATEWQIYFLFPLMLILWRKINLYISFIIFALLAIGLKYIIPFAHPQFIILFFLGVICCYFSFKATKSSQSLIIITCLLFISTILILIYYPISEFKATILIGIVFSTLLYALITFKRIKNGKIRFLENQLFNFLGKISYSLYLIHGPLLALANLYLLQYFNLDTDTHQLILFAVIIFIIIPITTLFYHVVEKRFLNT